MWIQGDWFVYILDASNQPWSFDAHPEKLELLVAPTANAVGGKRPTVTPACDPIPVVFSSERSRLAVNKKNPHSRLQLEQTGCSHTKSPLLNQGILMIFIFAHKSKCS